mgnify:CR=1 FL=1
MSDLAARLEHVMDRIRTACVASGRDASAARLLAVLIPVWATGFAVAAAAAVTFASSERRPTVLFGVAVLLVVGMLAAFVPARRASLTDPAVVLRDS